MKLYLLTEGNSKIKKNMKHGIRTFSLNMSPGNISGHEVCPHRGACFNVCVSQRGLNMTKASKERHDKIARLWFTQPERFALELADDLCEISRWSFYNKAYVAVRLNTGSDVPWEHHFPGMFTKYGRTYFYDYTKDASRWLLQGTGYQLTYSWNEHSNPRTVDYGMSFGHNVSVVYDTPRHGNLPKRFTIPGYKTYPVIDGDTHDLRLKKYDGSSRIVGLRFKGSADKLDWAKEKGFVIPSGDVA